MSLIDEKEKLIHNSFDRLSKSINDIQGNIYKSIMSFFMSNPEGKPTKSQLTKINNELKTIISKKTFNASVKTYLKSFDQVEAITKKLIGKENNIDLLGMNLNAEKKLMVEDTINGLLNDKMLQANLHQPLRKMLYRFTTTNTSLKSVQDELKDFVLSNKSGLGFAERYVRTIATESLSRFEGMINQRIADEYELDGFRIVGSLIKTSLPQCVQMVKGIGELGKYEVNGKYAMADLPKIISKLKANYSGVHKSLNTNNYFVYRNHWGCRHTFIPTRLLDKDIAVLKKRLLNDGQIDKLEDIKSKLDDLQDQLSDKKITFKEWYAKARPLQKKRKIILEKTPIKLVKRAGNIKKDWLEWKNKLKDKGYNIQTAESIKSFGDSYYIMVYNKENTRLLGKMRFSDHSVQKYDRVVNEIHNPKIKDFAKIMEEN